MRIYVSFLHQTRYSSCLRIFSSRVFQIISSVFLFNLVIVNTALASEWFVRPDSGEYGVEDGTSYQNAWDGFPSIEWGKIKPGDTIFVCGKHTYPLGIKASGVSGSPIVIRGDYSSEPGDIFPVDLIPNNWVEDKTIGAGVYKQDLGYDPWTIVYNDKRIGRIHSSFLASGGDGWKWLAKPSGSKEETVYTKIMVDFWEPVKAIYGYVDGTTYIRFGVNSNPNHMNLSGRKSIAGINLNGNDYINISNVTVKCASTGISLPNLSDYNNIEGCTIIGGNDAILIYDGSSNNRIANNTIYSAYYGADSTDDWGAWDSGTTYEHGIREQTREWFRHRFMNEFQEIGIRLAGVGSGNVIEKNTIYEKYMGIVLGKNEETKKEVSIIDNKIRNIGYLGLHMAYGWIATIQENDFRNCNITYRFQYLMNYANEDRIMVFKLNRSYLPRSVGNHFFWHTYKDVGLTFTIPPKIVFEGNLFVYGNRLMQIGLNEISTRKIFSDTSFIGNTFYCPTVDGDFDNENWSLIKDNIFNDHEDNDLPKSDWMKENTIVEGGSLQYIPEPYDVYPFNPTE